jgi:hypothetical protein
MRCRLVPLAVLLAAVLAGCGKKAGPGGPNPGAGGDAGTNQELRGDPNATYTIQVRDEEVGDKAEVSKVLSVSATQTAAAQGRTMKEEQKQSERQVYVETILAKPAGATRPTKLTRAYRVAETTGPDGKVRHPSYEGKTVTIEKGAGGAYTAKADGKALPDAEAKVILAEFNTAEKVALQSLVPKAPVKVGEEWALDADAFGKVLATLRFPADPGRSKITGRLARAYTKDGKTWGEVVFKLDLVAGGPNFPKDGTGTMTGEIARDIPIDGSPRQGTTKMNLRNSVKLTQGGIASEQVTELTGEETVTPVK